MAFSAPYGDLTTRGKLNQSITFRRRGNSVIMQGTPRPKPTRTPGQAAQRNRFISAADSWKYQFYETRKFYKSRARMISRSGRTFYIAVHMKDNLPSLLPGIPIKTVDEMFLHNTAGTLPNNFKISLQAEAITPQEAGCILWTKLDDLPTTITPEIGPVGSPFGNLSFVPGKFGNALDNTGQSRFINYPFGQQNFTQFVFGVWWQPHWNSTAGNPFRGIVYIFGNDEFTIEMAVNSSTSPTAPGKIFLQIDRSSGPEGVRYFFDHPGFAAESWHHLLFAFNDAWGDGGRARLYFDKIPQNVFYIATDDPTEPVDSWTCRIPGASKTHAAEDNPKCYTSTNYLSGIIDNINNEDFDVPPWIPYDYGSVEDSSNIFTPGSAGAGEPDQTVVIEETAGVGAVIPFYYPVWITWKDNNDNVNDSIMRLPEIRLTATQSLNLYLTKDFSAYYDPTFRRLAGTGKELL